MNRRAWTQPELLKTLSLYFQLPFGQMHARNRAVIELSREIGRTPSATALKLVNFASLDPELRQRGIRGMPNASEADRRIWNRFHGRWHELAKAHVTRDTRLVGSITAVDTKLVRPVGATETSRTTTIRIGQGFFRNAVLAAYECKCCVTGISAPGLLRASHISPWAADPDQRLNPRNGLCLNALHDAAFDRGMIAVSADLRLLVSADLREHVPAKLYETTFGRYVARRIRLPERFRPDAALLEKHRQNVFRG